MSIDIRSFRDALGLFVTGVTIITTLDRDGQPVGITANSFNSVSLAPPLVLWSVGTASNSLSAFEQADRFAVHILKETQQEISQKFAVSGADKFAGIETRPGIGGIPLLPEFAACLETRIYGRHPAGDHVVYIAEVERLDFEPASRPLVYHGGTYANLADMPASEDPLSRNG